MSSKKIQKGENKERWYYDACALGKSKGEYGEILRKNNSVKPVFSHLALGEAFGNSYLKSKKTNFDKLNAFVDLIKKLEPYIDIVENDGKDSVLNDIRETFPALPITDSMHIAIALENKCVCIKSLDPDFCGQDKNKFNELGKKYGLPHFSIIKSS